MKRIVDIRTLIHCLELFDSSASIKKISECVDSLGLYAQKLMQNAYNYCVECDGQIVGFISFYANHSDVAFLTLIAVEKSRKGYGIGFGMLEHAITVAKENGMNHMRLEVHKLNAEAISFYKRNGFVIEFDDGKQSYFMIKEL